MGIESRGLLFILWCAVVFFFGFMWWRIMRKAGYHGAMGILMLIPVVNIAMMAVLAFKDWPRDREIKSKTVTKQE